MDYQRIIDKYYPTENKLKNILMVHSRSVADFALAVIARHPELNIDASFVEEAAMLHDIGIFRCQWHRVFWIQSLYLAWTYRCRAIKKGIISSTRSSL